MSEQDTAPEGLWLSVSDIARTKGVEKSSVSRRVNRLEANGFAEVRPGPGGTKLINLAAYDRAIGEMTDEVRASNGRQQGSGGSPRKGSLAAEQARKTAYQADLAQLDLAARQGKLLPVEDVTAAVVAVGEAIVRTVNGLCAEADSIAAAVARDGAQGARAELKSVSHGMLERIAAELTKLARSVASAGEGAWPKTPELLASVEADTNARLGRLSLAAEP